jgi:hypothetical protein
MARENRFIRDRESRALKRWAATGLCVFIIVGTFALMCSRL